MKPGHEAWSAADVFGAPVRAAMPTPPMPVENAMPEIAPAENARVACRGTTLSLATTSPRTNVSGLNSNATASVAITAMCVLTGSSALAWRAGYPPAGGPGRAVLCESCRATSP